MAETQTLSRSAAADQWEAPDQAAEIARCERECRLVRQSILRSVERAQLEAKKGGDFGLMKGDVLEGYKKATEFKALNKDGDTSAKAKVEAIRELEKYSKKLELDVTTFSAQLREAIAHGKSVGGLTETNIKHMQEKLASRRGDWEAVKAFFSKDRKGEDTLTAWKENWEAVGRKKKEFDRVKTRLKDASTIPEVAAISTAKFEKGKVLERLAMLDKALEKLSQAEHGNKKLYADARAILQRADPDIVPAHKVERHLTRIFSKYKGQALVTYVQSTLPRRLEQDWPKEKKEFLAVQAKLKESGIRVKSAAEFMDMHYPERRSELMKMRNALGSKRHPSFDQIDALIEKQNWKKARKLCDAAGSFTLSAQDQRELFGFSQVITMELEAEEGAKRLDGKKQKGTPEEEAQKQRKDVLDTIHTLPTDLRAYYMWAFREGGPDKWARLRRLRVWHYNVQWAHVHGFMNDEEHFLRIKEEAVTDTERINQFGHREKGVEKIDLQEAGDGVESKHRAFNGGLSRGATWVKSSKDTTEELREEVDYELRNERKNYWGLIALKDVTLKQTLESYAILSPKLKALENAERAAGGMMVQESMDFDDECEDASYAVVAPPHSPLHAGAAEPQYASHA